jgi:hypothetical protein
MNKKIESCLFVQIVYKIVNYPLKIDANKKVGRQGIKGRMIHFCTTTETKSGLRKSKSWKERLLRLKPLH